LLLLLCQDREFIEMDSNVNLIANQLLQLKIQSDNADDNNLINNFINCFCCKHLRTAKSFHNNKNSNNSNNINNNNRNVSFF
jgi:hypothetical protein